MRKTPEQYRDLLRSLLPTGTAWPTDETSMLSGLVSGLSRSLARTHNRAVDLIDECIPKTSTELLSDWERVCGLPDPCSADAAVTLQARRAAVVAKLSARGGQSRAFFIALADALGYEITITEFRPFRTGISKVGDPVCSSEWWFVWRVNAPEVTIRSFKVGQSAVGEPLRSWGNQTLECAISQRKPAHTLVQFAYGE
jgi:uncharacterized protein YmfQ (DUF2313 family)